MTEVEAITILKSEIEKTIPAFNISVVAREFGDRCSEYTATIAVFIKDETIQPQTLIDIRDKILNDGITDLRVVGTKKNLNDLDFEVLSIEAEITI